MAPPTTITVTATYYNQDGTVAAGTVEFRPVDARFKNTANAIDQEPVTATLNGSGAISQTLVNAANGYTVRENITGRNQTPSYTIAGTGSIDLSTV